MFAGETVPADRLVLVSTFATLKVVEMVEVTGPLSTIGAGGGIGLGRDTATVAF